MKIDIQFPVGETLVDSAVVKPITFAKFAAYVGIAQAMAGPTSFAARLRRVRMLEQVEYHAGGKRTGVKAEDLMKMPIAAARAIGAHLDGGQGNAGKIIRDGDGVSTAIGYELGNPIQIKGKDPIKELEFLAKVYGDVEEVLAASEAITQTLALLRNVAKPVHGSLMAMPSFALDQISVADGIMIGNNVLPRFLGDRAEDPDEG